MKPTDIREYLATTGRVIRDPRTKARVPHEGTPLRVHFSPFWARREADGDVFTPQIQTAEVAPTKRAKSQPEG